MSAELNDKAAAEIDDLSKKLVKQDVKYIRIVGHTDSRGTDAYNKVLSRDRAESVRLRLKKAGMKASRMEADGVGPAQPIATNDTEEGRAKNRRVEIFVKE
jgi:outer membrane protein OmpA-like peptidoglycan-associated protein